MIGQGDLGDGPHHGHRADGDGHVVLVTLREQFIQLVGDKALLPVGAVVSGDVQVGAVLAEAALQEHQLLGTEAHNHVHMSARPVQGPGLGKGDRRR